MTDHDQRFKTLIRTFFGDFLRAFFAKWAEHFDLDHVEWSETEVFPNPPEGSRHRLDMIAKLKVIKPFEKPLAGTGDQMIAAVHVEVESPDTAAVLKPRMPYYYHFLRNTTGLPVLPIAIFLKVGFEGIGIDTIEEHFGDLTPIRFQYLYVGLPALDAIEYLETDNPLAWALSALMKIPPEKIMWLGEEAIKRIAGSKLNEQEKYLLGECVENYLPLDDEKWRELEPKLEIDVAVTGIILPIGITLELGNRPHSIPRNVQSEALCNLVNLFRVESPVIRFEEFGNCRFMDFHFRIADAQGTVADDAFFHRAFIHQFHAFDTRRRHGIEVDHDLQAIASHAQLLRKQNRPGGTGRDHQFPALQRGRTITRSGHRDGFHLGRAIFTADRPASAFGPVQLPGADSHMRPGIGQQPGNSQTDWSRPAENQGLRAIQFQVFRSGPDGSRSRRVSTVRIEHDRNLQAVCG